MRKRLALFVLLFVCLSSAVGLPTDQQLELLQTSITQKLHELRMQLAVMENELYLLQQTSSAERSRLEKQLETLKLSYQTTLEQLNSCYTSIEGYKNTLTKKDTELKHLTSFTAILLLMLVLSVLLKIGVYIAAAKGVKLPRWLEILL